MSSSASAEIQFNRIDTSEAERLLSEIWRVLEERNLTTPVISVSAGASIDIRLRFESARDRGIVEKELLGSNA